MGTSLSSIYLIVLSLFSLCVSITDGENDNTVPTPAPPDNSLSEFLVGQDIEAFSYFVIGRVPRALDQYLAQSNWTQPNWQLKAKEFLMKVPGMGMGFPDYRATPLSHVLHNEQYVRLLKHVHFLAIDRSDVQISEINALLKRGQIINYLPGRLYALRKDYLGIMMGNMYKELKKGRQSWMNCVQFAQSFLPLSFPLPSQKPIDKKLTDDNYWILRRADDLSSKEKPVLGKTFKELEDTWEQHWNETSAVIQKYIQQPYLLSNLKKWSLRHTAAVIQTKPLLIASVERRVFFAEKEFELSEQTLDYHSIHLVNKFNFGSDATMETVLLGEGVTAVQIRELFSKMNEIILTVYKAIDLQLSVGTHSNMLNNQSGFFNIFEFDFMVDALWNVYLLDVNLNPVADPLAIDSDIRMQEYLIKMKLMAQKLELADTEINDPKWQVFHQDYRANQGVFLIANEALDPPYYYTFSCLQNVDSVAPTTLNKDVL